MQYKISLLQYKNNFTNIDLTIVHMHTRTHTHTHADDTSKQLSNPKCKS